MEACIQDFDEIRARLIHRAVLIQTHDVQTQSELYASVGKSLGKIIINNMPLLSKELMGATDPLNGPNETLRMHPDNRLSEKLCLTETTKALTHEGVMDIGAEIEAEFKEEWLRRLQRALDETSEFEKFEYEKRLKFAVEKHEMEHKRRIEELNDKIRRLVENEYTSNLNHFTCSCIDKIKDSKLVQTDETQQESKKSGSEITNIQSKMLEKVVKCLWDDFKEHLRIQRHIITCGNVTEFMHVICAEKMNTQKKILEVKENYQQKMKFNKVQCCVCDCPELDHEECNKYFKLKQKYTDLVKNFKRFIDYANKEIDAKCVPSDPEFQAFKDKIKDDLYNFDKHCINCECNKSFEICEEQSSEEDSTISLISGRCNCHAISDDSLNIDCMPSPSNIVKIMNWSAIEDGCEEDLEIPRDSDMWIAKNLCRIVNLKDLLISVAEQINFDNNQIFNEVKCKFINNAVKEFHKVFNEVTILEVFNCCRGKQGPVGLLGVRDSVEILRENREKTSKSASFTSTMDDVVEDYGGSGFDLSERSLCAESLEGKTENTLKSKPIGVWDSLIKIPKYLIPPNCKVDSSWIYRKTTDEEWDDLLRKIRLQDKHQNLPRKNRCACNDSVENVARSDERKSMSFCDFLQ